MTSLNQSYESHNDTPLEYVVVSKTGDSAVLKVKDADLYANYWKEFISADVVVPPDPPSPEPEDNPMYVKIEQVPPEVVLIDQFSDFIPDIPLVYLEVAGRRVNISSKVAANRPNTEVPGLFRLDYRINLNKRMSSIFWQAHVSIQQRPLLRKAAAGWVRDSYIIKTLNRLVMEPQFMEALHAAGEPLYGFMQANQHPSIRANNLSKYADIQAWGAGKTVDAKSDSTIFITGLKLPQGSVVVYQQRMLQLQEPVYPDVPGEITHMNLETHERSPDSYTVGTVRRQGKNSYVCIMNAPEGTSLNDTRYWRQGYLYRFAALEEGTFVLPRGRLPIRKGAIEHIWVTVDNQGYPFWVDIAHTTSLGTYRGHYDKKSYADYNSDDIVSYVNENATRLFMRKHTDIQDESTLIYPPGHYLNPAWEEIYNHMQMDNSPLLSEYYVIPHTNASNAVIAKTWSVSEEMCKAYAHMVGIPQSIMDECGAKWSALLFALLVRTRNTYDGLRMCMRAVGLDVENLSLSDPSIAYYCQSETDDEEKEVKDIYEQHENLRKLVANISTLEPLGSEGKAEEGALRYDPEDKSGCSIQQYTDGEWVTRYRFAEIEPTQNFNNRYYDADLNVLARLAADAVKDLGDGKTWVKSSAWAGAYSALVADVIAYEIPIYVWVRLHMNLYDESKIEMETAIFSSVLDGQRSGGKNVIELFPTRYFSRALHNYVDIETGVFVLVDPETDEWGELVPTRTNEERGTKIYEFDRVQYPLRIRAIDLENNTFIRYWQSTHTFGLLGLKESTSTDHFRNVTDPEVTDESNLMLANGYVGVTALYRPKGLYIDTALGLRWMYVLNDSEEEETWQLSETEAFVGWDRAEVVGLDIYPFEGSVDALKSVLAKITTEIHGGEELTYVWDGDTLVFQNCFPSSAFMKDAGGTVIGAFGLTLGKYTLTAEDIEEYCQGRTVDIAKVTFTYG